MSWRSPLRRFVFLGGAVLWLAGFFVLAQERSFFAAGPAVGLTAEQASRGKAVYDDNCASCHGANLDNGQFGPPLRGSAFKMHWENQSANALFTYIATKMPPAAPGASVTAPTAMWRLMFFGPTMLPQATRSWRRRGRSPISPYAL